MKALAKYNRGTCERSDSYDFETAVSGQYRIEKKPTARNKLFFAKKGLKTITEAKLGGGRFYCTKISSLGCPDGCDATVLPSLVTVPEVLNSRAVHVNEMPGGSSSPRLK